MRALISRIFDAQNFFKTEIALRRRHYCTALTQFHILKTRSAPNSLIYPNRTRWTNTDR